MKRELLKEERAMIAKLDVVNYFVSFDDGSSALFYVSQPNIGENSIKKFCEKMGDGVTEVYHVPQDDLQYYCIDERIWIDTPEKADKLLKIAYS